MLDSILIGMSGLEGYSLGLRVISNNTANIDTPGFKSSTLNFADLFYSSDGGGGDTSSSQMGNGLTTGATSLNFKQGDFSSTGNDLDLGINGQGFFILKDASGNIRYTQDGQFEFNSDGILVDTADSSEVMGLNSSGQLTPITISGKEVSAGKATSNITFTGNLSSDETTSTVGDITVIDSLGGTHTLTADFTAGSTSGDWTVTVMDGTTTVGTGTLDFTSGVIDSASSSFSVSYTPTGMSAMTLNLDFSNVTSYAAGSLSSLAMDTQDGLSPAGLTSTTFDSTGTLVLKYSNGQTVNDDQLALANYTSANQVTSVGSNEFEAATSQAWTIGTASSGSFGSIESGVVEMSNVDLSQEFSNLVITERGYQASSEIVSTANDMLQQLFSMTK